MSDGRPRRPGAGRQRADLAAFARSLRWALSGFANGTVWLVFAAFVLAQGYEKTGLGRRIALQLVRTLGGNTLGLGYAIMLAEVTLAPFTPSNTARSAGAIYPVLRNIPPLYGSQPGPSARRLGAYVMWVAFAATAVTSSMFVTALAPNLLAVGMVAAATGQTITMSEWVKGFLPMAAVLVARNARRSASATRQRGLVPTFMTTLPSDVMSQCARPPRPPPPH